VTVDARYQIGRYVSATAATPNEPEVEAALGIRIGNNTALLEKAGRTMLRRLRSQALLITRGRDGMALFEPRKPTVHIPIHGGSHNTDVTGAGDTVIAVFTLALAAGATFHQAALLANFAGGIVVMKRGTATASAAELRQAVSTS
jgi:rfaE bifunctional protein kinase chain/domain